MSAYCCLQWLGCGRERKETGHPVLFIMNNMNMALTQHGVRNGDTDRRPQESLSLCQVLHPELAVVLAHPYGARGEYDIYDSRLCNRESDVAVDPCATQVGFSLTILQMISLNLYRSWAVHTVLSGSEDARRGESLHDARKRLFLA
jgi:hypothetical protein